MRAFVLAGGFATRLWPLTEKRAKPLLPLAGVPLLTHLVERIPEGMSVTVSTNQVFAEDFERWKKGIRIPDSGIRILIEDAGHEDEKLGALGAASKWIREEGIDEDVLLLAGDNYVGFSIEEFMNAYHGNPFLATHDIGDREIARLFGTVVAEGNIVKEFEEKSQNPKSTLVSTGVTILPKETLPTIIGFARNHPDHIGGIFEHFLTKGTTVECRAFSEPWFDIGSFESYLEATRTLVGERVLDCRGAPLGRPGEGKTDGKSTFSGSVVLGNGSRVLRSMLRNTVLFEHCTVEDCVVEDCIVDNGCMLKGVDLSGKMLREGTQLIRS